MKELIWYEKYRARNLSELSLDRRTQKALSEYIKDKQVPHLLLHGPVGSGKTTISMILIRKCASASLILNASSNDRGIATIKTKVKQFAMSKRMDEDKCNIILLDEADGLTSEAQLALKNTIETYHKNCRFIFTANDVWRIIDAISSRCIQYEFTSLETDTIVDLLIKILDSEDIEYRRKDIKKLVKRFEPDVRTIINNLQAGSSSGKFRLKDILSMNFNEQKLYDKILAGDVRKIRGMLSSYTDFTWLYKLLFYNFIAQVPEGERGGVAICIAEYLYRDRTVADRQVNMIACLCDIMEQLELDITF